jgi:hypothetical protein
MWQTLTIPSGAGPGDPRVIIDGTTGTIIVQGANPDDKIIITPNGPDGVPLVNLQSSDNPGDTRAGMQYHSPTGIEIKGHEYVDFVNGELVRQYLELSEFFAELGAIETSTGQSEGGQVLVADDEAALSWLDNGSRINSVTVDDEGVRLHTQVEDGPYLGLGLVNYVDSAANSAAILAGAEGAVLALPNMDYRAGRAYEVRHVGGASGSVNNSRAIWRLRKTNLAGQQLALFFRTDLQASGVIYDHNHRGRYFTVGAADVNANLIWTLTAEIGNVTHSVIANVPRACEIHDVGRAADYPTWPVLV